MIFKGVKIGLSQEGQFFAKFKHSYIIDGICWPVFKDIYRSKVKTDKLINSKFFSPIF